ncbi:MAG: hypothetical protein SNJ52_01535 [Verrucomicrobiia bacterium]
MRTISLSGGEVNILKAVGLMGTQIRGDELATRVTDMETAELIDTIKGLMLSGYIISDEERLNDAKDLERATFRVNTAYSRELRDTISGRAKEQISRRRRRG